MCYVFVSLLFVLSALPASAQDVELVVTATKDPVPADTLPVGVTVVDPAGLPGTATVSQALESTLAARTTALTPGQDSLGALGFGENGFGRTAFLVDGVSQSNPDMSAPELDLVPLFAIDRIEVLSGPASAVFGDGAVAGAVNLVTKTPKKTRAEGSVSVGSTGTNRQSAALGLPVGPGGLLVSAGRDQSRPTRNRSDSDRLQAWTKFTYPLARASVDQDLSAWAWASQSSAQLPGALTEAAFHDSPDQAVNQGDSTRQTESSGGLSWSASGDGWSLTVPLSASWRSTRSTTASWTVYNDAGLLKADAGPRFTADVGRWAGADLSWTGGLDLAAANLRVDRYPDASFGSSTKTYQVDRSSGALWTQARASWDDRWFATAVLRFEGSRTEAASDQSPTVNGSRDFWPVSGQAGVTWRPDTASKIGLELSRVFRFPFVDEMIQYSGYGSDTFLSDLDAEVGHGVGVSASWKPGPWSFALSGSLLKMENEVFYDEIAGRNVNGGPTWHAWSLGTASWKVTSWAFLGAEGTLETARFASGAHEGKLVPLVPAWRSRLWARLPWDGVGAIEAGWTAGAGFFTSGDFDNSQEPVPGRQTLELGASANLGSPNLVLRVTGHNLLDDRTPTYVSSYVSADHPEYNSSGWYPSAARDLEASLTWTL